MRARFPCAGSPRHRGYSYQDTSIRYGKRESLQVVQLGRCKPGAGFCPSSEARSIPTRGARLWRRPKGFAHNGTRLSRLHSSVEVWVFPGWARSNRGKALFRPKMSDTRHTGRLLVMHTDTRIDACLHMRACDDSSVSVD